MTLLVDQPEHFVALQHRVEMFFFPRLDQADFARQQLLELAITGTNFVVHQRFLLSQHRLHYSLAILAHDHKAVIGDSLNGFHVHRLLARNIMSNRPVAFRRRQTKQLEQTNVTPTDVHFVPATRQLGRIRIGVVIVVQLFTTNQDTQRRDVAGVIGAFEIPIAQVMADTIDHAGSPYRNPHHLDRPDPDAVHPEQRQVDHCHQGNTQGLVPAVEVALDPVFRGALAIALKGFRGGRSCV